MLKCKILEKATEMFLNLGFKSVTMDDISKDLGISKKTIYTHFRNKTELVNESTCYVFERIQSGIEKICANKLNAIEELFEIKQFVLTVLRNEDSSPQHQLQKFFPDIHARFKNKHLTTVNNSIVKNIEKGIASGIYRENIDKHFVSRMYFIGITGIKDEETFPKEMYTKQQLMEYVLDYHIRAIATEEGIQILKQLTNHKN
ncbi:TetR/AcrR family transcriptional regulator [Wenyingzhuangia sp. 2_MG-2023]|nr:TetR/AcrR family transcriptional regulator [Wenyingzhuangia sp. 2_MG-2023]MDO6738335.1 TetR/AcrR family transcriptional regulator [Wenyingzhuangia sp. 2_MG-2023]